MDFFDPTSQSSRGMIPSCLLLLIEWIGALLLGALILVLFRGSKEQDWFHEKAEE